jgi:hypothetical protein
MSLPFERDERDAAAVFLQKKAQAPLDLNGKSKREDGDMPPCVSPPCTPKPT